MKGLCSALLLTVCLSLAACSPAAGPQDNPYADLPMVSSMPLWRFAPQSLEELQDFSVVIVIGQVRFEGKEFVNEENADVRPCYTLEISRVYKGDFQPGDSLALVEPYVIVGRGTEGERLRSMDGYKPSALGVDYLFFLWYDDETDPYTGDKSIYYDTYMPLNASDGRFLFFTSEELVEMERLEMERRWEERVAGIREFGEKLRDEGYSEEAIDLRLRQLEEENRLYHQQEASSENNRYYPPGTSVMGKAVMDYYMRTDTSLQGD